MTSYSTKKLFKECVVDSNLIIGYFYLSDPLHKRAKTVFESLTNWQKRLNWLVLSEIGSVMLLRSKNQELTNDVLATITNTKAKDLLLEKLSKELRQETLRIFYNQLSSKLSITDCSLVAQARIAGCGTIVTFDKDLRREFRQEFDFLPKLVRA